MAGGWPVENPERLWETRTKSSSRAYPQVSSPGRGEVPQDAHASRGDGRSCPLTSPIVARPSAIGDISPVPGEARKPLRSARAGGLGPAAHLDHAHAGAVEHQRQLAPLQLQGV